MSLPKVQGNLTLPRIDVDDIKDVMGTNSIKLLLFTLKRVLCSGHITACFSTPVTTASYMRVREVSYGCGDPVLLQLHVLGGRRLLTCSVRRLKSKVTRVSGTTEGSVKLAQVHVK